MAMTNTPIPTQKLEFKFNEEQTDCISRINKFIETHSMYSKLLINGSAGTGKTTILISSIINYIASQINERYDFVKIAINNPISTNPNNPSSSNATAHGYKKTISISKTIKSIAVKKYLIGNLPPPAGWCRRRPSGRSRPVPQERPRRSTACGPGRRRPRRAAAGPRRCRP